MPSNSVSLIDKDISGTIRVMGLMRSPKQSLGQI